jgi:hypothetical protein
MEEVNKMPKKDSRWNIICNRFVAFLDIMGFRELVLRRTNRAVYEMLKSFRPTITSVEGDFRFISDESEISVITKTVMFSDSIILISNDDSINSSLNIISDAGWIISNAVKQRIPIKGAIAYGKQTADFKQSLHFGKPLIDAFELQNELQFYGIVLHHSVEKHLVEALSAPILEGLLIRYPVPMKSGKINHYIVDWTSQLEEENDALRLVSYFYHNVSGKTRLYVDNTMKFVQWLAERKIELER